MKLLRPWPPLIFAGCAAVMIALRFVAPGPRLHDPGLRDLGLAVMGIASGVAGIAAGLFRKRRTPILPFEMPKTLVTTGPYRFSRNPMYLMLALTLVGLALWLRSATPPLLIPVFLIAVTEVVIKPEEKRIEAEFGEIYRAYCRRVRRWV